MTPSLIILALAVNTSQAMVYSQIILSFGIPFALIPLLLITRDPSTMTDMPNRRLTSTLMLLVTVIITGLNLCLLYRAATGSDTARGNLGKPGQTRKTLTGPSAGTGPDTSARHADRR